MIVLNAGMYATFSFFAEFLDGITGMSGKQISFMLLVFGATGLIGNILSGVLLHKRAMQTALVYPVVFGLLYLLIFTLGELFHTYDPIDRDMGNAVYTRS
ncbi:hypothetical protein DFP94_10444 [Fontibacillus phaseoli]|uniref:MFS transporter n=1 Tax=Fontibacillus phaseoli TaxID=1416533 RepID=A0A369BDG8_9BACL|nr:MFS transporter [Fontibacillus phaseoli]RCX19593.1 hypothetical protein DFP94_10444 [Fontibacillus phaseoli]